MLLRNVVLPSLLFFFFFFFILHWTHFAVMPTFVDSEQPLFTSHLSGNECWGLMHICFKLIGWRFFRLYFYAKLKERTENSEDIVAKTLTHTPILVYTITRVEIFVELLGNWSLNVSHNCTLVNMLQALEFSVVQCHVMSVYTQLTTYVLFSFPALLMHEQKWLR